MNKRHRNTAALLKALGHPVRYCIVEGLLDQESNVGRMVSCTGVAQPTVSQHLSILRAAGIITPRRNGNETFYQVCSPWARKVVEAVRSG